MSVRSEDGGPRFGRKSLGGVARKCESGVVGVGMDAAEVVEVGTSTGVVRGGCEGGQAVGIHRCSFPRRWSDFFTQVVWTYGAADRLVCYLSNLLERTVELDLRGHMARSLTQTELLRELEPAVEVELNRHLSIAKDWHPHDYVPWSQGRDFAALGGEDWDPEQTKLSEVAQAAMITNLLTEDNLPSYHREIADTLGFDGPWGTWVGRWTAEENRHSVVMRDYLVVTRGVDPVALENARMAHMTRGWQPAEFEKKAQTLFDSVAYVTFQELATRVSHRNTGKVCGDPIADAMLTRVAADENLHMLFYRNLMTAGLEVAPDQAMRSITETVTDFIMPGLTMPDFRRKAVLIAKAGIYDLQQHRDEVVLPVVRKWRLLERTDFGPDGEKDREKLALFLEDLDRKVSLFEENRARAVEREARRAG